MNGRKVDTKLLLFTLILVLIVLLLLNSFFKNNRSGIWNYDEIETANDIIYYGDLIKDRQVYYNLEKIIGDFLACYEYEVLELDEEDIVTFDDYYKYLSNDYKKHLEKKEYLDITRKLAEKFYIISSDYDGIGRINTQNIIKAIYKFDSNVYLCKLVSDDTKKEGFIAIALDDIKNIYNIVYIE